jgi:hypothetical protein
MNPWEDNQEEEEAGKAWMEGIAREWIVALSDPREDIYTIADGEPAHAPP